MQATRATFLGLPAEKPEERTMKINLSEEAEAIQLHPLVRTRPVSGRKALFASPVYTVRIDQLSDEESFVLLSSNVMNHKK
jgi:taurine dioxygenase